MKYNIFKNINLNRNIKKSSVNSTGDFAVLLFEDSEEFAIIENLNGNSPQLQVYNLESEISNFCFYEEKDSIWFSLVNKPLIEWNYKDKVISRTCGNIVSNKYDNTLSGYYCVNLIAEYNLLIACNAGSYEIEFYNIDNLTLIKTGLAGGSQAREISIHQSKQYVALLINESEDASFVRFYFVSETEIKLFDTHIQCYFAATGCTFSPDGSKIILTGGYPPFSLQVQEFPSLDFLAEIESPENDYPSDFENYGRKMSIPYNCDIVVLNNEEAIVPYFTGEVMLINYIQGRVLSKMNLHSAVCTSVSVVSSDKFMSTSVDGVVSLWNTVINQDVLETIKPISKIDDLLEDLNTRLTDLYTSDNDDNEVHTLDYTKIK